VKKFSFSLPPNIKDPTLFFFSHFLPKNRAFTNIKIKLLSFIIVEVVREESGERGSIKDGCLPHIT
jgi:hypothetical protein